MWTRIFGVGTLSILAISCCGMVLADSAKTAAPSTTATVSESILTPAQRTWLQANPSASYAPESDYGPFIYVDPQGKVAGMSVDFLALIQQKTGLQFQAQNADALSVNLEKAKQKQVDLITSLRPTPERAEFLSFTPPYVAIPAALFLPAGKSNATTLQDMAGRKIAVGKAYAVEGYVREKFAQIEWVAVASDSVGLQMMAEGKVDGMVADIASVHFLTEKNTNVRPVLAASIGFEYPLSFAYRKDKAELGEILQKGLQAISIAERDQVLQKWLPSNQANNVQQDKQRMIMMASISLVVGAGLSLALRRFRKR